MMIAMGLLVGGVSCSPTTVWPPFSGPPLKSTLKPHPQHDLAWQTRNVQSLLPGFKTTSAVPWCPREANCLDLAQPNVFPPPR